MYSEMTSDATWAHFHIWKRKSLLRILLFSFFVCTKKFAKVAFKNLEKKKRNNYKMQNIALNDSWIEKGGKYTIWVILCYLWKINWYLFFFAWLHLFTLWSYFKKLKRLRWTTFSLHFDSHFNNLGLILRRTYTHEYNVWHINCISQMTFG